MGNASELVTQFFDCVSRGDVQSAVALVDPSMVWVPAPNLPWSRGEYHGPEGVLEYLNAWARALVDGAASIDRVLDCGTDAVALGRGSGRARLTGNAFSVPFAFVFTARDGKLTRMNAYIDTATIREAFKA